MEKTVLDYFYNLMQIPRESGNEEKVVDFLEQFAKNHNLNYVKDNFKNIVITKNTSNKKPLILQAHTDMVCVKEPYSKIDFSKDNIEPIIEGEFLKANGTSLGADNGIGLAMALKLLTEDLPMNVEAVFTSEEETTMFGAENFDANLLKGKDFISLDGSKESCIDVSSASMNDIEFELEDSLLVPASKNLYTISVSGLVGGHSGQDIDKNRGNAFALLANFLLMIEDVKLVDIDAKVKANVIPTFARAIFETSFTAEQIQKLVEEYYQSILYTFYAPKLKIEVQQANHLNSKVKVYANTQKVLQFVKRLKIGSLKEDEQADVLLSANLYMIDIKNSKIGLSVRASVKTLEENHLTTLQILANSFNYKYCLKNYLPFFQYKPQSKLRDILIKTHKEVYGYEPKQEKVHAGLEAGVFAQKIPDVDICVIAPAIYDLHSTTERVQLPSIERTYEWLKAIVKEFK